MKLKDMAIKDIMGRLGRYKDKETPVFVDTDDGFIGIANKIVYDKELGGIYIQSVNSWNEGEKKK